MPNESAAPQPEPKQDEKDPESKLAEQTTKDKDDTAKDSQSAELANKDRDKDAEAAAQHWVVQVIKTLGGGGWFVFVVLRQDWALAGITFLVLIARTAWKGYTKSVLSRVSELAGARGLAHVDTLVGWAKIANQSLTETIKWRLSGFEVKYLECQGWACLRDDPLGLDRVGDGVIRPLLQEIFVPLELTINPQLGGYAEQQKRLKRQLRKQQKFSDQNLGMQEACIQSIWDLLKQVKHDPSYRQMLIRAKGGYGKTTLLKHLTYVYCQRNRQVSYQRYRAPKFIPFLIILAIKTNWQTLSDENAPDLPDFLTRIHLPSLPKSKTLNLKVPPNWIAELLEQGKALVMFDGFDEVPKDHRLAVSQWINRQMREFPESVLIVTSRPAACLEHYNQPLPSALLWVRQFSTQQQAKFIRQWYSFQEVKAVGGQKTPDIEHRIEERSQSLIDQLQARPELADLAGNPLLLNMMCRFHKEHGIDEPLPQRRVELYQDICEVQTARRPKERNIPLCLRPAERLEVLQILALAMMLRAKPGEGENPNEDESHKQIKEDDLLDLIVQPIGERDPEASARDFLRQMVEVSELLVETQEKGIYEFSHLSFQEFLAASEVVRLKQESILYDKLAIAAWEATILLYGELSPPSNLIREAMKQHPNLAYKIYQTTAKRLDLNNAERAELERLKKTVASSRYEKLEALMIAGDWKGADDETYRLMITTVGKEEGQWFTSEELLNFPCEELLAIDRLWVQHSQGQFGFSVQKEIYVACGAKLDGKYPGDKIWEDFATRVGWREHDDWKSRDELKMNPHLSPKGEFPSKGHYFGVWGFVGGGLFSSLASRLVNCSRPQS
ncbi:MAG: NACHT domain-containing protein [Limnothrix sp. BL-A-16]